MNQDLYKPEFHDSFSGLKGVRRLGANYVWLLYSVFFFIDPFMRKSGIFWAQSLAVYAVFLGIYIWFVETKRPGMRLPLVIAIFALGVATIHWNEGASFFLIFAAALIPFATRTMRATLMLMVAELGTVITLWLILRENPINFAMTIGFSLIVGLANLFVAEQKRAECRLKEARDENAALSSVAERERIARDLHDVLGHTLSVIVLKAELAGRLLARGTPEDATRAANEIADVEKTARTALAEVREAIGGYRAKGFAAEVDMARSTLEAAGVVLQCETLPPKLKAREETALSLALREAVTNIVRHAGATQCTLRFSTSLDGFTQLAVEDNGIKPIEREGNGLRGMRARVEELGGRFRIERGTLEGTRLVIELPQSALA